MLTPATSASTTSSPRAIRSNASSTQVLAPPFLNCAPLAAETTTGRAGPGTRTLGAAPAARWAAAAAAPAAAVRDLAPAEDPGPEERGA